MGGCCWLASCCSVVVGGCSWLAVVVDCAFDRFVVFFFFFFFGSEMYYFIVIDILLYCDVYIILLC